MERLTDPEKEKFYAKYGKLVTDLYNETDRLQPRDTTDQNYYRINYRTFNFESAMELRLDLMEYLRKRDEMLIPQLLPTKRI